MTSSKLKLYVSLGIVLSHILIFFGILSLRAFVLPNANVLEIMGATLPLFGVFLVVIIKDTIRGRENLAPGNRQTPQMIALTFLLLASYIVAALAILLMVVSQAIEPQELPKWLAVLESAFGVALGLIIDDLFGGNAQQDK